MASSHAPHTHRGNTDSRHEDVRQFVVVSATTIDVGRLYPALAHQQKKKQVHLERTKDII
jgi:G3E family GTPase